MQRSLGQTTDVIRYAVSICGIVFITLLLAIVNQDINATTAALAQLLAILFIATIFGRAPALVSSFIAAIGFNFFFLPPFFTLTIADPQNWVALVAFMAVAVTAGQLSANAKRRAQEAEDLYAELQVAFEKASHAEALERSEKLKSALLDAVTHDLRTPLTSIKASVTTLLESREGHRTIELDEESKNEFLVVINEETDRLNKFIEGMVELAKVEAGSMSLNPSWSSIAEILEAALFRAEGLLKNKQIAVNIEKDLPLARVDSRSLAEVIYTLIDNAAKYSPADSTVTITAGLGKKDSIDIAVTDEGNGIPEELHDKIFEKFFRANSAATANGMGLGLTIAKAIIEAHGGKIAVKGNAGGEGSTFIVTVPIGDE